MLLPIYDETVIQSDAVVESYLTSHGGTYALLGETFSEEYLSTADAEYISPDKMVDASTCRYKDVTWHIKDAQHVGGTFGSEHADFAMWLLSRDTQPSVYTDSTYPRFMAVDENLNFIK